MIVIDAAFDSGTALHKRLGPSCHMCSNLPGADGTRELIAFAKSIGMREEWIQKPGTRHEHFDLFGGRRARAIAAGAVEVTRREIVGIWRAKRVAEGGE